MYDRRKTIRELIIATISGIIGGLLAVAFYTFIL